jgi:spore maturation protein CgeB
MRIVMFYHSLLSDWNHGNAHFLRGIASELIARGHRVDIYEPEDSWSLQSLRAEHGEEPIRRFHAAYPQLRSTQYSPVTLDLDATLDGAGLVIVHEWNAHELVRRVGEHRARNDYVLLFHDTHHRMVTQPESMAAYDLSNYDGVLAYGEVLRELYEARGNVARAWTWHEAADTRVFKPLGQRAASILLANDDSASETLAAHSAPRDLVWVGNWGDDERTAELHEFLIEPAKELNLNARVYGVRYPDAAQSALRDADIEYGNWLPNFEAPRVFAEFKFTVHVPRRPYVKTLPGIPTIRPFEALACGIPLICSPWNDAEHLFRPGTDYLIANNGPAMKQQMRDVLNDPQLAAELARNGLETIRERHTCAHRVDELLNIYAELTGETHESPSAVDGSPSPLNGERGGQSQTPHSRDEALGSTTPHPHSLSPLRGEGGAQRSTSANSKRISGKEVPA